MCSSPSNLVRPHVGEVHRRAHRYGDRHRPRLERVLRRGHSGRHRRPTQITGTFTHKTASNLADVLKYGALPLAFQQQTAQTISATLGSNELKAGLLAGGIGLVLVLFYSFFYYRGLSFVTVTSLALSAAIQYPIIVLLGKAISYTLTLAGIAGLIVAIGVTADSFVVFFERLRDEVRDGNSLRTSVERGWVRARRTIISADVVSLIASVILYLLAIGDVRGFAFTLVFRQWSTWWSCSCSPSRC